jgi:hypothetical protein
MGFCVAETLVVFVEQKIHRIILSALFCSFFFSSANGHCHPINFASMPTLIMNQATPAVSH